MSERGEDDLSTQFRCTYDGCGEEYGTERDMKRHKAQKHEYCKKCDVDCEDWEELYRHKVAVTQEFWRLRDTLPHTPGPKHITCEVCGTDVRTFGALKDHRGQSHPVVHRIDCVGCRSIFTRASGMIKHLESGECFGVTAGEFNAAVLHKHVRRQIMKDPAEMMEKLGRSAAYRTDVNTTDDRVCVEAGSRLVEAMEDMSLTRTEVAVQQPVDILESRFYDASSADWNEKLFLSDQSEGYFCPFPHCDGEFKTAAEIGKHLEGVHLLVVFSCSTCHKRFQTASAQVSHMESEGNRCKVQESRDFCQVLDEITGGSIAARRAERWPSSELLEPAASSRDGAAARIGGLSYSANGPWGRK